MKDNMRDKLIKLIDDYTDSLSVRDIHKADFAEKFADFLMDNGFGLVDGRDMGGMNAPCKLGDVVYVPYHDEVNKIVYLDELQVTEVSNQRLWVGGDDGYDFSHDDIGESVFLSYQSGDAYFRAQGKVVRPGEPLIPNAERAGQFCGKADIACEVGDTIYELRFGSHGQASVEEVKVLEVSTQRVWVDSNYFDYEDFGKSVFTSREAAEAYLNSPEHLAERVNLVLHWNISDEAKREFIVGMFAAGQEFFEPETQRYMKLTAKGPFDVWKFDVFDKDHEFMYSEAALGVRLAIDIMNGDLVPAVMVKEKSVSELISEAAGRSEKSDAGQSREQIFNLN